MKKRRKRNPIEIKPNQLSFDFSMNIPIEIHTPKSNISDLRKELAWEHRPIIEIVKS
jgi:predicted metal-dependent TIM-barrel fold hydrolase